MKNLKWTYSTHPFTGIKNKSVRCGKLHLSINANDEFAGERIPRRDTVLFDSKGKTLMSNNTYSMLKEWGYEGGQHPKGPAAMKLVMPILDEFFCLN